MLDIRFDHLGKRKIAHTDCLVPLLFAIYMVLLIWAILFKMELSIHELETIRSINLIPFYYENEVGMNFHLKEVVENALIFIPLGIYLCMLTHSLSFKTKLFIILLTSSLLEIFQYVLSVGRTDITDVITNTCGGIIGIGLYGLAVKIFHGKKQADKIITIFAVIVTVVVVGGLSILLILN